MKILWLIAARAGSKSIPHKNIKELGGIPLLNHRIIAALDTKLDCEVWITTDSVEYAKIAEIQGAKIPFIRPSSLASDEASSIDVVLHAMKFASEQSLNFDAIGLLEPTSPFVTSQQLKDAVSQLFEDTKADSIVAVKETRPNTFFIQNSSEYLDVLSLRFKKQKSLGRQFFKTEITPCGGFYIAKWANFLKNKTFYSTKTRSYLLDEIAGLEIDEPIDWLWAEFIINQKSKS
jgi:CMP-N,N'-diacetyllegionaminic acid synthase